MDKQKPPAPARPSAGAPRHLFPTDSDVHLLDRLNAIYKHRYVAVSVFLLVLLGVVLRTYTTVPMYRATTSVLIEDERGTNVSGFTTANANDYLQDPEPYFQTQLRILQGRELAGRVVDRLHLDVVPEFNGQGPARTGIGAALHEFKAQTLGRLRPLMGGAPVPAAAGKTSRDGLVNAFLASLTLEPVRGSRLVNVSVRSSAAALAARASDALVEEYVKQNSEMRTEATRKSLQFLSEEIAKQQQKVEESERAMADYREHNNALSLEDRQNTVVASLNQLNDQLHPREDGPDPEGDALPPDRGAHALHATARVDSGDHAEHDGVGSPPAPERAAAREDHAERALRREEPAGHLQRERHRGHQASVPERAQRGAGRDQERLPDVAGPGAPPRRRARFAERRRDGAEPEGRQLHGARARGAEQPAGIRAAAAAPQGAGSRQQRRGQQRAPHGPCRRARRAVHARCASQPPARLAGRHPARRGPRRGHRLPRRHGEDTRGHHAPPEAALPGAGAGGEGQRPSAALQGRPARVRRGVPRAPHVARLQQRRRGAAGDRHHERSAARRQDDDRVQHGDRARLWRVPRAADRRRPPPPERGADARHGRHDRAVAPARGSGPGKAGDPTDRRPEFVGHDGGCAAAESLGAALLGSHEGADRQRAERTLRLGAHRHAAGARGDRRGDHRAVGVGDGVHRRIRDDPAQARRAGGRNASHQPAAPARRRAQSR